MIIYDGPIEKVYHTIIKKKDDEITVFYKKIGIKIFYNNFENIKYKEELKDFIEEIKRIDEIEKDKINKDSDFYCPTFEKFKNNFLHARQYGVLPLDIFYKENGDIYEIGFYLLGLRLHSDKKIPFKLSFHKNKIENK